MTARAPRPARTAPATRTTPTVLAAPIAPATPTVLAPSTVSAAPTALAPWATPPAPVASAVPCPPRAPARPRGAARPGPHPDLLGETMPQHTPPAGRTGHREAPCV